MKIQRIILTAVLTIGVSLSVPADEPSSLPTPLNEELQLQLNFKNVNLQTVLDYLSKAGGFVIIGVPEIPGTITVSSHQPLNRGEAVQLLDTILSEKGYAAIRNGRMLRIVHKSTAKSYDLPVIKGNDPVKIPKSDSMVTQIIPVRYTDAESLLENIKPLLGGHATISSNKTSNAIILTDTQTNIRRITSIIQALDSSISDISSVKVFPLVYGDPVGVAQVITETFKAPAATRSSGGPGMVLPFFKDRKGKKEQSQSDAQAANTHLTAIGDVRSNSLVVCAPAELLSSIQQLIEELDVPTEKSSVIRVYPLTFADSTAMATTINELFNADTTNRRDRGDSSEDPRISRLFGKIPARRSPRQEKEAQKSSTDSRNLSGGVVTAVADTRTNSVIVTAAEDQQVPIKTMLATLDDGPSRSPRVFVYKIRHANLATLKEMLENMFNDVDDQQPAAANSSAKKGSFSTRDTSSKSATKKNRK